VAPSVPADSRRVVGALLIEQNDEWLLTRGYLSKESIALVLEDQGDAGGSRVGGPGGMTKCRRVGDTTTRDLTPTLNRTVVRLA
jgi:hypothetical protein